MERNFYPRERKRERKIIKKDVLKVLLKEDKNREKDVLKILSKGRWILSLENKRKYRRQRRKE